MKRWAKSILVVVRYGFVPQKSTSKLLQLCKKFWHSSMMTSYGGHSKVSCSSMSSMLMQGSHFLLPFVAQYSTNTQFLFSVLMIINVILDYKDFQYMWDRDYQLSFVGVSMCVTILNNTGFGYSLLWYPNQGIVVGGRETWTGHAQ